MTNPPCFCTLDSSQKASKGLEILHEAAVVFQEPTQISTSHCWDGNTEHHEESCWQTPIPSEMGFVTE